MAKDIVSGDKTFADIQAQASGANAQTGLNDIAAMNGQAAVGPQAVVNNTNTETVKQITIVNQLDGEAISKSVMEKQQFESARQ
jgi:hypothetical protein